MLIKRPGLVNPLSLSLLLFVCSALGALKIIRYPLDDNKRVQGLESVILTFFGEVEPNDHLKLIPVVIYRREEPNYLSYYLIALYYRKDNTKLFLCEFHVDSFKSEAALDTGRLSSYYVVRFHTEVSLNERRYLDIFFAIDDYFQSHFTYSFNIVSIREFYHVNLEEHFYSCRVRLLNDSGDNYYLVHQSNSNQFTVVPKTFITRIEGG